MAPPPATPHGRGHGPDPEVLPGQVDLDDPAPHLRLGLLDRAVLQDASVVDQDGNRSEGVLGSGDRGCPVVGTGDVEADESGAVSQLAGERLALVLEDVRYNHRRALLQEGSSVAGSHAAGSASDDHSLIVEVSHDWTPMHCVGQIACDAQTICLMLNTDWTWSQAVRVGPWDSGVSSRTCTSRRSSSTTWRAVCGCAPRRHSPPSVCESAISSR